MSACKVTINKDKTGGIVSASVNYTKLRCNMNFNKQTVKTILTMLPDNVSFEEFITIVGIVQAKQSKEPRQGRVRYSVIEIAIKCTHVIDLTSLKETKLKVEETDFKGFITYYQKAKIKNNKK